MQTSPALLQQRQHGSCQSQRCILGSLSPVLPERSSDKPTQRATPLHQCKHTGGTGSSHGRGGGRSCPHCNELPAGSPGLFSMSALRQACSSSSVCLSCLKTNNQTQTQFIYKSGAKGIPGDTQKNLFPKERKKHSVSK